MTDFDNPEKSQWHLDKRVPLALILTILLQSMGAAWWASMTTEKISQIERRLDIFSTEDNTTRQQVQQQGRDIAVLAEQIKNTNNTLDRLSEQIGETNSILRLLNNESFRNRIK